MYIYTFVAGNPQDIEYTLQFNHSELFTYDTFTTIVEDILTEYYKIAKYIIPTDIIIPMFENKGLDYLVETDRIDSKEGYIVENVVSCCKDCNIMKMNMSNELFLRKVLKIYQFSIQGRKL